jgi:glycosyltransferase involved in cell wall biosynthesis
VSTPRTRLLVAAPTGPRLQAYEGGSRVTAELLTRLAERHDVGVLHLRPGDGHDADAAVREACAFVEAVPVVEGNAGVRFLSVLAGLARGRPRWATHLRAPEFGERLRALVEEWSPDIVQLEYHVLGQYLDALPPERPPVVLIEHDPGYATAREHHATHPGRGWRRLVSRADVGAWKRFERRVLAGVDAVVAFTRVDAERLTPLLPPGAQIEVIPFGLTPPIDGAPPAGAAENVVLFVGSFVHPPNVDAAMRLLTGVQPLLAARRPDARLVIVGEAPTPDILAVADGAEVTGRVPDVAPYYAAAAVVVAPIRLGGGIRVKVLEALAAGRAVVSSRRAVAGLDVVDGEHLVLAETDAEFADRVAELLADPGRREELGRAALAWAAGHGGWERTVERYEELYGRLAAGRSDRPSVGVA